MEELERTIQQIAVEQARLATRVDALCEQIQETKTLVNSVNKLALAIEKLTNAQNNTSEQVARLRSDVDEMQKKPSKRLDTLWTALITAILSGAIGFAIKAILG
jgi:predicted  nucleic acid-binding Zn-ribbon protein